MLMHDKPPITTLLPQILESLTRNPRLVLEAPPGAGKTTRVPLALLGAEWLAGRRILMLEPRRVAARAAAEFMAAQLREPVGQTVGYRVRFDSRVSLTTRIEVLTEGILTRWLLDDPELAGVGAIIFDEFHERHLHGDVGAALSLEVQRAIRPDLRLVVMSATMQGERVARWLDAPRITSPGRSHPVQIIHPEVLPTKGWALALRSAVQHALRESSGDVLVFLPGRREIRHGLRVLAGLSQAEHQSMRILPLHGELDPEAQRAALAPAAPGTRRIVLATNLAESSLTLPGVTAVVDGGEARVPRFDPSTGLTRLATVRIAQDSADQRAGRAGRVAPGLVLRLWPRGLRLETTRLPEIVQADLAGLALDLAIWGAEDLPWLDPPPSGALAQARDLLRRLGGLDEAGHITARGRAMHRLGAAPRLAAAAIDAAMAERGLLADLLALIENQSPLRGEERSDDLRLSLAALSAWRTQRASRSSKSRETGASAWSAIERASAGWRHRLETSVAATEPPDEHTVGDLLLPAYPDRIARQSGADPLHYSLSSGGGARLREASALRGQPWLVVTELRAERGDALILQAAPFGFEELRRRRPQRFARTRELHWNSRRGAAEAYELEWFDSLVLDKRIVPMNPSEAGNALLAAIRSEGLALLPWDATAQSLRRRVAALRSWLPELGLPDLGDAALLSTLDDWLGPAVGSARRLADLSSEHLLAALRTRIGQQNWSVLAREAPTHLRVPSGRELSLDYTDPATPVLAVKLQELFGMAETPRIARGRVPVTLHLLSPSGRPIQVTRDLRSFWDRTYAEVRRELKGRYPRHPWPDNPWIATPSHRAKPRGS